MLIYVPNLNYNYIIPRLSKILNGLLYSKLNIKKCHILIVHK